jgi:hypothetical protein
MPSAALSFCCVSGDNPASEWWQRVLLRIEARAECLHVAASTTYIYIYI